MTRTAEAFLARCDSFLVRADGWGDAKRYADGGKEVVAFKMPGGGVLANGKPNLPSYRYQNIKDGKPSGASFRMDADEFERRFSQK